MSEYNDCRRDLDVEAYVAHEESRAELEDIVAGSGSHRNGRNVKRVAFVWATCSEQPHMCVLV